MFAAAQAFGILKIIDAAKRKRDNRYFRRYLLRMPEYMLRDIGVTRNQIETLNL